MIEISLVKKLTSICFCEERGEGGMEDGHMEDGGWRKGRLRLGGGDFVISIVPWPFGAIAPTSDWFKLNSKIKRINIPVV
jgi:hypothetical protein